MRPGPVVLSAWLPLLVVAGAAGAQTQFQKTFRPRDARLHWVDASRPGVLTTPGFGAPPGQEAEEAPARAVWLIHGPPDTAVFVYMTQLHLPSDAVRVESFFICLNESAQVVCHWEEPRAGRGRHEAHSHANTQPVRLDTRFAATMRRDTWLVLSVDLSAGGGPAGQCLQADSAHGFNLTYEVEKLADGRPVRDHARRDICWVQRCNYNGDCLASADFRRYYCHCRPGFYGEFCQYGALCDPNNMINPCQNNGSCTQQRGAVTCECPPPYYGKRCQREGSHIQEPKYCEFVERLHCQHGCVRDSESGAFRCACHPGYRQRPNGTCCSWNNVPAECCCREDMQRFIIELRITDRDIALNNANIEDRFGFDKSEVNSSEPLRVMDERPAGRGESHLRLLLKAPISQENAIFQWFASRVIHGRFNDVGVRPLQFSFRSEPELVILSLTINDEGGPRRAGSHVQFTCRMNATQDTQVEWYKDGAHINVSRTALLREQPIRRWSMRLEGRQQYNHYLLLDKVVPEDEGRFECRARDRHGSARRAVHLRLPSLELSVHVQPPLASVRQNGNVTLSCIMSRISTPYKVPWRLDTTVVWSKSVGGGEFVPLTSLDEEEVVTYCWGRSLLIIRRPETAVYRCEAVQGRLTSSGTARVRVLGPGMVTCPPDTAENVTWQETPVERTDLQPCPGHGDDLVLPGQVLRVPIRYAHRRCLVRSKGTAMWDEPDLSRCIDTELFVMQKEADQLLAGYNVTSPEQLLARLRQTVQQRLKLASERQPPVLGAAETHAVHRLLVDVGTFMLKVVPDGEFDRLEALFFGSVEPLVSTAAGALLSDKDKAKLLSLQLEFLLRRVFVRQKKEHDPFEGLYVDTRLFKSYGGAPMRVTMPHGLHKRPDWMRTFTRISMHGDHPWRSYAQPMSDLGLVVAVSRDTATLYPLRYTPEDNADGLGRSAASFVLSSALVSVGLSKRPLLVESPFPPDVEVQLQLAPLTRHWNASSQRHSCARLDPAAGGWTIDACQLSSSGNSSFNCSCRGLGMYALALVTKQPSVLRSMVRSLHLPVVVGCLLSVPLLLYSAGALLVLCVRRPSVPAGLQLQGALVLLAAMAVFLVSAREAPPSDARTGVMAVSASALQCLVLSAMCTQMALKMHVFGEQFRLRRRPGEPNYFKYIVFFISIGVPILVMAATVTTQNTHGWHQLPSWWIVHGSSFFYGVVVPVALILLIDTGLLIYVRALLVVKVALPKLQAQDWIQDRLNLMMRSHLMELMLVLLVIASALYINFRGLASEIVFAMLCVVTSVVLLVCSVLRGEPGLPSWTCSKKTDKEAEDVGTTGDSRDPPATLRSHAALRSADISEQPLLSACGCRPARTPTDGSATTDECALSSGSSSSSGSAGPPRRQAAARQPLLPPAAARAAPLRVAADVSETFDPPPKPGRVETAARGAGGASPSRQPHQAPWAAQPGPSMNGRSRASHKAV